MAIWPLFPTRKARGKVISLIICSVPHLTITFVVRNDTNTHLFVLCRKSYYGEKETWRKSPVFWQRNWGTPGRKASLKTRKNRNDSANQNIWTNRVEKSQQIWINIRRSLPCITFRKIFRLPGWVRPFGPRLVCTLWVNVCLFHCLELYEAMRESFSEYVAYGKLETATCLQ